MASVVGCRNFCDAIALTTFSNPIATRIQQPTLPATPPGRGTMVALLFTAELGGPQFGLWWQTMFVCVRSCRMSH